MKYVKKSDSYILRFSQDEQLVMLLEGFVLEHKIKFAWLSGLGACKGVELGFYNLDTQEYQWRTFTKLSEIINLTGNVSWLNNKPKAHLHITLTDDDFKAYGGHLKELIVGGTVEIKLALSQQKLKRVFDDTTGLNVLDL